MARLPDSLKDFALFIDGVGQAGKVEEGTPPKIALVTAEVENGGMAGTVDIFMGMVEKMEFSVTLSGVSADFYRHLGKVIPVTLRGATDDGEAVKPVIYQMRALVKEDETGTFKRKDKATVKLTMTPQYLKLTVDGQELREIDILGNKIVIDGVDLLADQRTALGG
jgi:P2 family phage contractile tail tube protein